MLLRTKRRQIVFGGVVGILVILAIILGVLASQDIIGKSKQQQQQQQQQDLYFPAGECVTLVYRNVPGAPPNKNTKAPDINNVWCAESRTELSGGGSSGSKFNSGT